MKHKFKEIGNPKVFYDYDISEEYVAGMILKSNEVKSFAMNQVNIAGSWVKVVSDRIEWIGATISPTQPNELSYVATIPLLLNKHEIKKLVGKAQEKGMTLAPIKVIQIRGKFKLVFGVAKGKKEYDKRADDKKNSIELDNRRIVKSQKLKEE